MYENGSMTGLPQKSDSFFWPGIHQLTDSGEKRIAKCIAKNVLAMGNTSNKIFLIVFIQ